jgi:hypothetical protein
VFDRITAKAISPASTDSVTALDGTRWRRAGRLDHRILPCAGVCGAIAMATIETFAGAATVPAGKKDWSASPFEARMVRAIPTAVAFPWFIPVSVGFCLRACAG